MPDEIEIDDEAAARACDEVGREMGPVTDEELEELLEMGRLSRKARGLPPDDPASDQLGDGPECP